MIKYSESAVEPAPAGLRGTRPNWSAPAPMLGFQRFETAAVTIRGIELAEKIKKHQFNLKPLTGKETTAPETSAAVLAA